MIIGVAAMAPDRPGSGRGSPAASRPAPAPRRRIPPAVAGAPAAADRRPVDGLARTGPRGRCTPAPAPTL